MFGFGKKKSAPPPVSPLPGLVRAAIMGSTSAERAAAVASLRTHDASAVAPYLVKFMQSDSERAHDGWTVAVDLAADGAIELLRLDLEVTEPYRRSKIAENLGKSGLTSVTPLLLHLLDDYDVWVRKAAAWAFSKTKDAAAIPSLKAAVRDRDCNVGIGAVAALRAIEPASGTELLCDVLADTSLSIGLRGYAAEKLREVERTHRVLEVLEQAAQDPSTHIREAANTALGKDMVDMFFRGLPKSVELRRRDWCGLPNHLNPATCSGNEFVPLRPGVYALQGVQYVQGQPWVILCQGGANYLVDGGDFRAHWPDL